MAEVTVIPGDGEFHDVIAPQTGNVKEFYIETPAFQGLLAEEVFGHIRPKTFEAALGVLQIRDGQQTDQEVNDPPANMAVIRLVITHGAWGLTRRDHHIGSLKLWWQ